MSSGAPSGGDLTVDQQLERLSIDARAAEARRDFGEELRLWRIALALLPPGGEDYETVRRRIIELGQIIDAGPVAQEPHDHGKWKRILGPAAPVAFLLWKFKAILLAVLSKGKLILFGLSKFSTFSTMLLSMGAYWALYGWKFAIGLVLSIYVHEMGHVYALRRFGFAASAPTFIPLLGAFVRMKQHPVSPVEDARIGLAGPIWGTTAAIGLFGVYAFTGIGVLGVIAHFAAWLNLFNLLPVWQLDGARGMRAMSFRHRLILIGTIAGMWLLTFEGFLLILGVFALIALRSRDLPETPDTRTMIEFCGLIVVLAILMAISVPTGVRSTL
jgi:Zn-dependent protease